MGSRFKRVSLKVTVNLAGSLAVCPPVLAPDVDVVVLAPFTEVTTLAALVCVTVVFWVSLALTVDACACPLTSVESDSVTVLLFWSAID